MRAALALVLGCLVATSAVAIVVEAEFVGGGDVASAATYCWMKGRPAPNPEVEWAVHQAVDGHLAELGYRLTQCEAELEVVSITVKDDSFPGGVLKIEISLAGSDRPDWRGTATGVVVAKKIKKRQQHARVAVKKMFRSFPESRGGGGG